MRDSATSYLFSMIDVRLFWVCMDVEKTMRHAACVILKLTTTVMTPTGVLEPLVSFSNTSARHVSFQLFSSFVVCQVSCGIFRGVTFLDATSPVTNHTPATFGFICTSAVFLRGSPCHILRCLLQDHASRDLVRRQSWWLF